MKDFRDRLTFLLLKKKKSKAERHELRHYLSVGIYRAKRISVFSYQQVQETAS